MIGDIICYRNLWNGIVLDYFTSEETGKTIIHILFVKNIYKQQQYDVIDYEDGMLSPSTLERMEFEALSLEHMKNSRLQSLGISLENAEMICNGH